MSNPAYTLLTNMFILQRKSSYYSSDNKKPISFDLNDASSEDILGRLYDDQIWRIWITQN